MAFWKRLRLTLEMIKFEHSVFALPFALTGALLALRESRFDARAVRLQVAVDRGGDGGRASAAMAFNRVLDADIDARNPRTRMRHCRPDLLTHSLCLGLHRGLRRWSFCSRPGR